MENAAQNLPLERIIALDGGRNFRDLGGYPTTDGKQVRWGLLFRSGSLSGLTDAGWAQLTARDICTVCDFRTERERLGAPFAWAGHESLTYWAHDYQLSFAELGETLRSGFPTGEAARNGMIAGYRDLPYQLAPAYRALFGCLKANAVPLVFNCAAGKDRAGTAAALILMALGVRRDIVVQDYLLTNEVYDVEAMLLVKSPERYSNYPAGVGAAIARADAAYIEAALDAVAAGPGGLEGYLDVELGVGPEALLAIRQRFLE